MPKLIFLKQKWTTEQKRLFDTAITELAKIGIHDDVSFFLADLIETSNATSIPLPILAALQQHLASTSNCHTDSKLIQAKYIKTPYPQLNHCLLGGLRLGDMIEVTGSETTLLEKFSMKTIDTFLTQYTLGKVIHIDTTGRFQSRLLKYPQMSLSRIECNSAFTITEIDRQIERYGAVYLASRRQQQRGGQQPLLIVIEDMGYLLDSEWNVVTEQVLKLRQTILLLKSMNICIMVSCHVIPNRPWRILISWNSTIDQRIALSSTNGMQVLANITKSRHVKTPQECQLFI